MQLNQVANYTIVIVSGFLIRLILVLSSYQKTISDRVETSTPLTSWKRVIEAINLLNVNISPYSGEIFHETPLFLYFYKYLYQLSPFVLPFVFILTDFITSILLGLIANNHLTHLYELEKPRFDFFKVKEDRTQLELSKNELDSVGFKVLAFYLLCPYTILACVAQSTGVFSNLLIALSLLFATFNQRLLASFFISLLAFNSFHSLVLVLPVALIIEFKRNFLCDNCCRFDKINFEFKLKREHEHAADEKVKNIVFSVYSILATTLICLFCMIAFFITSFVLMNHNFEFVNSTFLFLSSISELTPNTGLFWYFFTEMFDHFREFFLWTIQINSFIWTIPLAINLKKNPYFYFYISLMFLTIFKPYPSVADLSICLAFIPQWTHLFNLLKHGFIISANYMVCSIIAPIMWFLWIVVGTGNANFYFGITLAFNVGQIFLFTNSLFAYAKRQFYLDKGMMKDENSKPLILELAYNYET